MTTHRAPLPALDPDDTLDDFTCWHREQITHDRLQEIRERWGFGS